MALGLSWLLLACEGWLILTGLLQIGLSFSGRGSHRRCSGRRGPAATVPQPSHARYPRRRGRQHAKAGNLNEALPHCHGELMAVFEPVRDSVWANAPSPAGPGV